MLNNRIIVLVALGLCALIIAGYYQPFDHHVPGTSSVWDTTVSCSLQKWWWPECSGRLHVAILEVCAVIAFAVAARTYFKLSGP